MRAQTAWRGIRVGLRRRTHWKRAGQAALDAAAWSLALFAAGLLRLDLDLNRVDVLGLLSVLPLVWCAQGAAGFGSGLYRGRWVFGSFEEVAALARTVTVAGLALLVVDVAMPGQHPVPVSAVIGGSMIAFLMMGALRYGWRLVSDRRLRPTPNGRTRVVVFGAGEGGRRALLAMLRDPASPYVPVALLDDDPHLANLSMMGVRVLGNRTRLAEVAAACDAKTVVIAVPSASAALVGELIDLAVPLGLDVRVLPSVRELLGGEVRVVDIREPTPADLLGRHQVEIDLESVSHYLTGRRVAVTGAGGSIGTELCRQITAFSPSELLMIDRDESALHTLQLGLEGRALLNSPNLVLLNIRDRVSVRRLFEEHRPDVVFHAAALKHLPLLEAHPVEALKTNVWGTLAVLDAAAAAGVGMFVNISTDKAANPGSVLGYTKRIAEGLTSFTDEVADGTFLSVRFGNVLGSRGSVLTAFRAQIEAGGPLTVTHPDVERFFMTVEEAVQLVVQGGAMGRGGQVLVLDMGEPVRIADVARRLSAAVDPPCPIEFVGLRPGEKLREELFGEGETSWVSAHPLIRSVDVPALDPRHVRDLDAEAPTWQLVEVLRRLCASLRPGLVRPELPLWPAADDVDEASAIA